LVLAYSVRIKYAPLVCPVVEKSKMRGQLSDALPGLLYLANSDSVKSPVPMFTTGSDTYGPVTEF
jgi:hypothetical protein